MKYKKTPQAKRETYKLFDDDGNFVTEYKPGENGVTEVDILNLHKVDDHEVYINAKENRLPEWYQPVYDEWKKKIISDFKEQHGREPFTDELPGRHRVLESLDGQADSDGDELGDSSRLEENLAVYDGEDVPDTIDRLREIVAAMPEQWQKVYRLVLIEGRSKAEAGRIIGISDVRVGQLVRKINAAIAEDEVLKKFFG
jgi:hypothetical protein|nr:MAG TPA: RNA polymerase sigma-70 factor [Caudoviricetes sp.]